MNYVRHFITNVAILENDNFKKVFIELYITFQGDFRELVYFFD